LLNKINTQTFKHILKDIHKSSENRKFCFIIGAGASVKSGIPSGEELAKKWFKEINEIYPKNEINQWKKNLNIDSKDYAAHYGSIYQKRFEIDKESGYEFLVKSMREAKPSLGHFVLAQILTKAPGQCVLTTNFDNLIETAIYQFTDQTPLVCGHESLSGYAKPSILHPLIIKIHRDLLLEPKNDEDQINQLNKNWKKPLDNIFSNHIPVIIGYGGNDGSLMNYLKEMQRPSNIFWCGKENEPKNKIKELFQKIDGNYIKINGFDELMFELLWTFDEIEPIEKKLDEITKNRIQRINKQIQEIVEKEEFDAKDETHIKTQRELSAFEYSSMAKNEPDYEKRKVIYLKALDKYPKIAWLWNQFTYFMQFVKKDYSDLQKHYDKALAIDPEHANNNGNYAIYLSDIKKDYKNAEKYYLKALAIEPDNANKNGNYANFLTDIKKDYKNAEKYYLKALAIDPEHANYNGNYANFLKNIKKDYKNAEKYYLKALAIDPEHANNNGNYANFLKNIKKEYKNAEKHFLKALAIDPEHANNNGNYAIFLKDIKKDYKNAEKYYLKALAIESDNAKINCNYANYLSDIKKDYKNAEKYYLKALAIEPDNANINGNYAKFLLITNRKEKATKYLEKAFQLHNHVENELLIELWFYKYAHYLESINEAEKEIEKLLIKGIKSPGWDLSMNVKVGIENGHPNPKQLKVFANKITNTD